MRMLLLVAVLASAALVACTGSNNSAEESPTPTPVTEAAQLATPTPADTLACPSPTPCPECPEPTPCPEETPCPVCPEPITCPTCPESPACPPPTVCPDCPKPSEENCRWLYPCPLPSVGDLACPALLADCEASLAECAALLAALLTSPPPPQDLDEVCGLIRRLRSQYDLTAGVLDQFSSPWLPLTFIVQDLERWSGSNCR